MIDHTDRRTFPLPILSHLEKKLVLVLGTDLDFYIDLKKARKFVLNFFRK